MSAKRSRATPPTVDDFYKEGREVQNRSGRDTGSEKTDDRLFREFFGCGADKALIAWNLLEQNDLIPEIGDVRIEHLLWTLFFLKQYPTEGPATAAAGGSKGKIDPKTYRKYVHPIMEALADLQPLLVSICVIIASSVLFNRLISLLLRLHSTIGTKATR
jgi:hypothetical protein